MASAEFFFRFESASASSVLFLLCVAPFAAGLNNGVDLVPPMGWSNWESSGCNVSEALILANAQAMIDKGLQKAGYSIVGIDDCWAEKFRNKTGHLVANSTTFPSGIKALSDKIHALGFKFGIYSSAGAWTCQRTMPGSLGYEWIDAQTFAAWGVDYLKYDGCFMEDFESVLKDANRRYPFSPTPILRYPIMAEALNKTGRKISYLCNFPWQFWNLYKDSAMGGEWVGEFCNAWRTGGDAEPGFSSALSYVDGSEKYSKAVPSGPGRWNHLDSLEIGNNRSFFAGNQTESLSTGMTEEQEQAIFSLFALLKSPLWIGASAVNLQGHSLQTYLNDEVIAIHQDPLGARGGQLTESKTPCGEVWAVNLSNGGRGVVLLNRGAETCARIVVRWAELGVEAARSASVRDLWKHKELGVFKGNFSAEGVGGMSAVVLRLNFL